MPGVASRAGVVHPAYLTRAYMRVCTVLKLCNAWCMTNSPPLLSAAAQVAHSPLEIPAALPQAAMNGATPVTTV
jgi:hypothetical protein